VALSSNALPLVSVVMPAFNAGQYIGASIQSILLQSYSNFELIIMDDASTDNTAAVVSDIAINDGRVHLYRNKENLGIAGNRNKGASLAIGKYLAWQDADDISLPNRLALQVKFMEEHPAVGIMGGSIQLFDSSGDLGLRHYPLSDQLIRRAIFKYSPITQPAAMVRVNALAKVGPYDLECPPAEDLDMTFRIGSHYQLANIPEVLVRYRVSPFSATAKLQKRMEKISNKIRWQYSGSPAYNFQISDFIFNALHLVSIYLVPTRLKFWLFSIWRNEFSK